MLRRLLLPALGLTLMVACGDSENGNGGPANGTNDAGPSGPDMDGDQWLDDNDNCPAVTNFEQRDRDNDGIGDLCDSCPATPNAEALENDDPCLPVEEQEPNDEASQAQALELLPLGQFREVRGVIETPRSNNQAFDRYQITVDAGDLYRIRVARSDAASSIEPAFEVTGPDFAARQAEDRFVATREVYFPRAGTYEIAVTDRRGLFGDTPRGGDTESYALSIEAVEAQTRTVEIGAEGFEDRLFVFEDPNSITILESTITEGLRFSFFTTRTELGRGEAEVGLDTILVVELPDQIFENDDVGRGVTDSQLTIEDIPADTPIRIVLDHARRIGPADLEYEIRLTVQQNDRFPELEPNDTVETASPLQYPVCDSDIPTERREQVDGLVESRAFVADTDWYEFTPAAGDVIRFEVGQKPGGGGSFSPFYEVLELRGGTPVPLYEAEGESSALIPMVFPESRPYFLKVDHGPNLEPNADPSGGPLFDYRVFMQCLSPVNREPFTASSSRTREVVQNNDISRYALVPQGQTVVADVLVTQARLGTDPGSGPEMTPELQLLGEDAVGRIARSAGLIGFGRVAGLLEPEDLESSSVLTIFNPNGFQAFNHRLAVDFEPVTPTDEEADEPNNRIADATAVATLPVAVKGSVTPSDPDFIRFTGDGSTLDVFANANGNTIGILITDEVGNPIENQPNRILDFDEDAGEYIIRVTSNLETDYTLVITDRPTAP